MSSRGRRTARPLAWPSRGGALWLAACPILLACGGARESSDLARDGAAASARATLGGAVVRRVRADLAGDRAGVLSGDRIVAWRPATPESEKAPVAPDGGWQVVATPFELIEKERQAPDGGGGLELQIERDGRLVDATLEARSWGLVLRPSWSGEFESEVARQLAGDRGEAPSSEGLESLLEEAGAAPADAAWLWRSLALDREAYGSDAELPDAARALDSARSALQIASGREFLPAEAEAGLLIDGASEAFRRQQLERVAELLGDVEPMLATLAAVGSEHLRAEFHRLRGDLALYAGDLEAADASFERCLEVVADVRQSRFEARCLARQAQAALEAGDLERAASFLDRALPMALERAPGLLEEALVRNSAASLAMVRGRAREAQSGFQRAYEIYNTTEANPLSAAFVLFNLGVAAAEAGEVAEAERRYLGALASVGEGDAPWRFLAGLYNNLSNLVRVRGEFARAVEFAEKNLALRSERAPDSAVEILGQITLAGALRQVNELERARQLLEEAAQTSSEVNPGSLWQAATLGILGETLLDLGESAEAIEVLRSAVELGEQLGLGAMSVAVARYHLALALIDRQDLGRALAEARQAVAAFESEGEVSSHYAFARYVRGLALWRSGERIAAREQFERALAMNQQQALLLDSDERGTELFRRRLLPAYLDLVEVLLEMDELERAFETVERSRAQSMIAMLGSRDLALDTGLDPELRRSYREVLRDYEEVRRALAGAESSDLDWIRRREAVEAELDRLEREIRRQAPELAALTDPRPMSYAELAAVLDPGTVLLSYVVREEHTLLFVVRSGGRPVVHRLPVGHEQLAARVDAFQILLRSGASPLAELEGLQTVAGELGETLLGPVLQELDQADRLALSVDGPLLALAWPALRVPSGSSGEEEQAEVYLVERLPVHRLASLSTFGALRRERRSEGDAQGAVVLADPAEPSSGAGGALRAGERRAALPGARDEAAAIRRSLGPSTQVLLGRSATEQQLEALPAALDVLHFASHAEARPYEPLNSALLLAGGGGHDGVLHAWEVLQRLRVSVDLVALSGCETDVGQVVAGEGLIGLTRAFQYAGANSVLASQWLVDDRSTADLMAHFYGYLSQELSKDEALRRAQEDLLAGRPARSALQAWWSRLTGGASDGATSHPYHWAGFQLSGDWR